MNPSILFPDLAGREWLHVPWKNLQGQVVVICRCAKLRASETPLRVHGLVFRQWRIMPIGIHVSLAECPDCRSISWSCERIDELILACEERVRQNFHESGT